jgi:hypothetical protein
MIIGFTGSQFKMTQKQIDNFKIFLSQNKISEFHHGDCVGADYTAYLAVLYLDYRVEIHTHPPDNDSKRQFTNVNDVIYDPKPYLERNHDIVDACDTLIVCPATKEEQLRSGTWATVRYARKKNKPIIIMEP